MDRANSAHSPEQVTPLPSSALPCLSCGYDLRGSVGRAPGACPKCGCVIDLRTHAETAASLSSLIDQTARSALGCGFVVFFLLAGVAMLVTFRGPVPVFVVTCLVAGPALWHEHANLNTLLRNRSRSRAAVYLAIVSGVVAAILIVGGTLMTLASLLMLLPATATPLAPAHAALLIFHCFAGGIVLVVIGRRFGFRVSRRLMRRALVGPVEHPDAGDTANASDPPT